MIRFVRVHRWKLATAALIVLFVAASAYALRARDSAIRGWNAYTQATSEQPNPSSDWQIAYRASWYSVLGRLVPDDLEYAIAVSDYLHRNVELGPRNTGGTLSERLSNALLEKTEQAYCGDYSSFLRLVLQNSGIPSRTVQLASQAYLDGVRHDTHVTVEALINGKWVILDPTFNATFSCGGSDGLLSIEGAQMCERLIANQHPATLPGRRVDEHPVSYESLLEYWMRAETNVDGNPVAYEGYPDNDWLMSARTKWE